MVVKPDHYLHLWIHKILAIYCLIDRPNTFKFQNKKKLALEFKNKETFSFSRHPPHIKFKEKSLYELVQLTGITPNETNITNLNFSYLFCVDMSEKKKKKKRFCKLFLSHATLAFRICKP
jgi:hypothetical protein